MVKVIATGLSLIASSTVSLWMIFDQGLLSSHRAETARIRSDFDKEFKLKKTNRYEKTGLWEGDLDYISKDCENLSNKNECLKVMYWTLSNGKCQIFVKTKPEESAFDWYLDNLPGGLAEELEGRKETYKQICTKAKEINFLYDSSQGNWKYDGIDWYEKNSEK